MGTPLQQTNWKQFGAKGQHNKCETILSLGKHIIEIMHKVGKQSRKKNIQDESNVNTGGVGT